MVKGKPLLPSGASKERLFSSTQELNTYLETPKAKAGQIVEVLEGGVYQVYVLQTSNGVLVQQHIGTEVNFGDLDLTVVTDENDETKKFLVLGDDNDDSVEYARVELPAMGGAGSSYVVMRLKNALASNTFTVPYDGTSCSCVIAYNFTSIDTGDNNSPTGNGTAYYYVDGTLVLIAQNLEQGLTTVDLGSYLTPNRTNNIKVTVVDAEGNRKSLMYYVTVAYNYLTTTFNATSVQTGGFSIPVTPNGSGSKTIYCKIDNVVYATKTTRASSTAVYFDIAGLSHGGHIVEIYMDTTIDGYSGTLRSNTLTFGVVVIDSNSENKILYLESVDDLTQYAYATPTYVAYSGSMSGQCDISVSVAVQELLDIVATEISNVKYFKMFDVENYGLTVGENPVTTTVNDITYVRVADTNAVASASGDNYYLPSATKYSGSLRVDSGVVNTWQYRLMWAGNYTVVFSYGGVSQTVQFSASKLNVAKAETSGLKFLFDPVNRSNDEPISTRESYSYTNSDEETYTVNFSGIDFKIYGWSGNSLKIPLGGSMTIPFQPFSYDVNTTRGKTIEMCFKITGVYDYEQNVISCYASNQGIRVTANKGSLNINTTDSVSVQYNDETEIRLSFVIAKRDSSNNYRGQLVYVFVNSDIAGVITYADLDEFVQNPAANIVIGSEYAEIEVYKVRCYDIELFQIAQDNSSRSYQILDNYIADSPNVTDMLERNSRNDIFDDTYSVDFNKLPDDLPYMVIECPELPQYKGDKKTVSGYYVDKAHPENSFTFENAEWNVQGTSSQGYYVKNFKGKFKGGIKREIEVEITIIEEVAYISMAEITAKGITVGENPTTIESEGITYVAVEDTNITIVGDVDYITHKKYQLYNTSIPTNAFCLKADVASSEGANNVVLMKIWDDMIRWLANDYNTLTPAQLTDSRIRQTIDGKPIVVYWKNTTTGDIKFWGKYNFNNDKGTPEVFGFVDDENHTCQSWEFRDNGLNLTEFKDNDFDTIVEYTDKYTGETSLRPKWWVAFEARFPDDFEDTTRLRRVVSWVASTNTASATNTSLGSIVYYPVSITSGNPHTLGYYELSNNTYSVTADTVVNNSKTYYQAFTTDTAAYRLAKFKNEFTTYFLKDLTILYYIFTDIFLMVDSRAKNQFITTFDGTHWFFFPYDGDTALGIDNIGALNFGYWLEDDSIYNGSNVYNGQESVLWNNVKAVFQTEIKAMLDSLVSAGFTYEYVKAKFDAHQQPWSEAVFCADTECKYIKPYFETGTVAYLNMAQGSKALQRDYWLKHRFNYYFSKYMTGTAIDSRNEIQMRMTTPTGSTTRYREVDNPSGNPSQSYYYEKVNNTYVVSTDTAVDPNKTYYVNNSTVVITPFTTTYVIAGFGSTNQKKYCEANESVAFQSTLDSSGDSMLNVFNASEIKSMGDLSDCFVKRLELGTMATNLESIILGNEDVNYTNEGLTVVSMGNSKKLKVFNVSNCPNLTGNINLSNCYNIREILAKGTQISSVSIPAGSQLRVLKLPDTITNLSLVNQINLQTFDMEGYENLRNVTIQNTPVNVIDLVGDIVEEATNLTTLNLLDVDWTFNDSTGIEILNMLADKSAILSNTVNVSGHIYVPEINSAQYNRFTTLWRGLTITYGHFIQQYPITFKNYDGSILAVVWVNDGETTYANITIDGTTGAYYLASTGEKLFDKPTRPYVWDKTFEFTNVWDRNLATVVREAGEYVAQYTETARQYTVKFEVSNVEKYSVDITAGDSITYDSTYGKPQKDSSNNTWYLPKGWTDTGVEIYTSSVDNNRIFGIFSTLVFNETMLSAFVATVPTVLKPTFVLNAIFQECGLPDNLPYNPTYTEVRNYVSGYDYVYTNDPNYTSAYTLPELYAASMSDKFSLYLDVGDKMRIYFDGNTPVGGDNFGTGHDIAVMEIMGFNVYERADSDFGEYVGNILGTFADPNDASELVGKSAGLYICTGEYNTSSSYDGYMPNGAVYYWDGTVLQSQKVTQYFSHVMWRMALGDNAANNASGKKYGHIMDTQQQMNTSATTINGWGDDTASTNKKCKMNQWLNDGISGVNNGKSIFSMFPSELQAIITPVKVISAKGAYYPEGSSSQQFSPAPVISVSNLFLACYGELWSTEGTPYINEINKWASICNRDSSNNLTKINRYTKIVSNSTLICRKYLGTSTDAMNCWTRSASSTTNFVYVSSNGSNSNSNGAYSSFGVPLCFCTG